MTTTNKSSVLKDVVAFVDVWSSEKTANYSKPFIQQLQEMGAQVSKTFNKQVTHVVFNNGHSSTWRKAKKSNVHLVSLLWIGRCYENDVHADEELYPALNDESNPVLKNKRHRCMRPKDSPERRPENDWRMRKKLDKMMKDLPPKQPVATDVSSIFIDEENGIVYSPALKRSDYMARRLKDMKDKRENLSPTASQMTESCSPTGLKPFLGSTPTLPKFLFNESDDESSASVAELDRSPDKEEGRTALHVTDPEHSEQQSRLTDSVKPWLSPLRNDPKRTSSPERQDDEDRHKRKSRRASVKSMKKYGSVGFLENPSPGRRSNNVRNVQKQQSLSAVECESSKCAIAKPFTENLHLDTVKSPRCSSSSAVIDNAAAETSKETPATLQKTELKTPRQAKSSLSALVKSLAVSSEPKGVGAAFADEDEVFDDFFSPANNPQRSKGHLLPNLPGEGSIHIPFELEPVLKKRKQRTSESWGSEGHDKKKKKKTLEKSQKDKTISETFDASSENHHQHQDSLPVLDSSRADATPITESKRQRSLVSAETGETSSSAQSVDNPVSNLQKNSEMNIMFDALQSE
uniref:BRCT domain-containing protein n=1 Tax=Salarias fasciatus TaxID=181472 RepID=A0A672JKK4_SALFA